ncbi:MAG TPA: right-handed parallel beta-helix repeat-containing protein [Chitinophagaceae bacterium]|nr:right-handed parallel beta-helix repeat-containing protein [Chitinophagaceae bacterium]
MREITARGLTFVFIIVAINISCVSDRDKAYYVSQAGNDNNPGTKSKPFKSLQKLNTLQLNRGTIIYLKGGEVFSGTLSLTINGSADKPIVVSSYQNEQGNAIIDGGNKEAIILQGSHFELRNINVKGAGRENGNITNGITLTESSHVCVENIKTEGFQKSGLELRSCRNIKIKNVHALDNGFCGIHITGSKEKRSINILVKDCKAENNPGDPTNLDNHSGNGILAGWSDSVIIDHCTATNNGWDMPRMGNGPVGIWAYESDHVIIQYCISYKNRTSKGGKDGGGFDLDGGVTNSVIQYCLSYENEGAGYGLFQYAGASLWHSDTIRYCISINDAITTEGSGGIFIWNGADDSVQLADCIVHNNVVYSTHAPAIQFEPMSRNKNFSFYNNIFIGAGQIVNGPSSGEKFVGNVWWNENKVITFRGYKNLFAWSEATGQEKLNGQVAGKQTDPFLKGPFTADLTDPYKLNSLAGYTLKPESPLKNKGLNLQTLFKISFPANDFFDNPVPQGENPEPGIHEIEE